MAGYIAYEPGLGWGASSRLFYWVIERLADRASTPLRQELRAISEHGVGMVDVVGLADEQADELFALAEAIPELARREFSASSGLPVIVEQLEDLVRVNAEARAARAARAASARAQRPGPWPGRVGERGSARTSSEA